MKIYLATWLGDNQGKSLTEMRGFNRLLSYFFIRQSGMDVKQYVKQGLLLIKDENISCKY